MSATVTLYRTLNTPAEFGRALHRLLGDGLLTMSTLEVFDMVTMDLAGLFKSNGSYPVADLVDLHVREYPGVD
jgi:hypothetical protein